MDFKYKSNVSLWLKMDAPHKQHLHDNVYKQVHKISRLKRHLETPDFSISFRSTQLLLKQQSHL